jgi:hypothetical protein
MNCTQIAAKLDLPVRLARKIVNEFVETNIFVEIQFENEKESVFIPGVTESKFTVKYIVGTLEKNGVNNLPISDTAELMHINAMMLEMDKALDTELGGTLVRNLVK